jgi:hypothetical protein
MIRQYAQITQGDHGSFRIGARRARRRLDHQRNHLFSGVSNRVSGVLTR